MSEIYKFAFFKTLGIAIAGPYNIHLKPIPIISGATPPTAYATNLAKIGSFSFSATDLLASNTTLAPSVT